MRKSKTVLYLDDNADHRDLLTFIFEDAGYSIVTCSRLKECLDLLSEKEISALVMDYRLHGAETAEASKEIKQLYPKLPLFFFTGDAQDKSREKAMNTGAQGYLLKPDDLDNIVPAIDRFLAQAFCHTA